jgi:hypothetical protein
MKITKRIAAIALSVVFLVAIAALAQTYWQLEQALNRPDLQQNPITKHIKDQGVGKSWGTRISLIPDPLAPNSNRTEVEQRLGDAGFTRLHDTAFLARLQWDLDRQGEVYSREANNLVCNIQLYVVVSFDEAGELAFADAAQYEHGCL